MGILTHPESGDIVLDRYRLFENLGTGNSRDIWKAQTLDSGNIVAVHFPVQALNDYPHCKIVFEREYKVYKMLQHPSITKALEYGIDKKIALPILVMEFLGGKNLSTILKEPRLSESFPHGPHDLIRRIAESIVHVHNIGFVHSNLKPGKIFINEDGSIKLNDFTIARALKAENILEAKFELELNDEDLIDHGKLGALTPAYASPEMLNGERAKPSDDAWALALIAFQIFAGFHPFNKLAATRSNKSQLNVPTISGLSRRQNRAFQKALRYELNERLTSINQFVEELKPRRFFTW